VHPAISFFRCFYQTTKVHVKPERLGRRFSVVRTEDEIHQHTSVLELEVSNAEATIFLWQASFVPAHKALSARHFPLQSKEGAALRIQCIYHIPGGSCNAPMAYTALTSTRRTWWLSKLAHHPDKYLSVLCDNQREGSEI
jgi:hypothetical protein